MKIFEKQKSNYDLKDNNLFKKLRHGIGKAISDFGLIKNGDRIAVAVSGGKDSYTMLLLLQELRRRAPVSFELIAVNINSGYLGYRADIIEDFFCKNGFSYKMVLSQHYDIIKEKRRPGSSYCSICSRLKRGALYETAQALGCNKLALGHHQDDFIETLLLNQFFVGSLKSMSASMLADNGVVTVIRPLVYLAEEDIASFSEEVGLPVVCCCCPACGTADMQRKRMKKLLNELQVDIPHIKSSLLKALSNVHPRHLLDPTLYRNSAILSEVLPESKVKI
ncbi:MAG: tRNA 2-thiocytidine(32) synthetase TtcA [Desulfuromonadaceae bacterium]|nr:tRNA 2-thiocytidine(32) synthetase TtcA [Desulfuromonadaceae bacterium]MDD2855739.1 tRNA 2-thiocytidine(32) synthetase TtcA [Desulfuromonadaceae bacterium]